MSPFGVHSSSQNGAPNAVPPALLPPQPEFLNLCFWFVPPSLRGRQGCADFGQRLGKVSVGSEGPPFCPVPVPHADPQLPSPCRWPPPSRRG